MSLPKIKVCGVTRQNDLQLLADSGVDTVGINLVPTSKRFLSLDEAVELAQAAKQLALKAVAVVMNPTGEELHRVCQAFEWDFVQLHGLESPRLALECGEISIIKAVGWSGRREQVELVQSWQAACNKDRLVAGSTSRLSAFLLDAYAPGVGGGTGHVARWDLIYPRPDFFEGWPLILAGGLTPSNVVEAIVATKVVGVDVASGVEEAPGQKSKQLLERFVAQARMGFAS